MSAIDVAALGAAVADRIPMAVALFDEIRGVSKDVRHH